MNAINSMKCEASTLMSPKHIKENTNIIPPPQLYRGAPFKILDHSTNSTSPFPSAVEHSSPSGIEINTSGQIRLPPDISSSFTEQDNISFSDGFPEIVPSWLTHDFMKVSDHLPSPDMLSNVSCIYNPSAENESLEMLDLGFSSDLGSHPISSNPSSISQNFLDDKLIIDSRFTDDSMLMSPFTDVDSSIGSKILPHYNNFGSYTDSQMLCDNGLNDLALSGDLRDQCLSSSSPQMISTSQAGPLMSNSHNLISNNQSNNMFCSDQTHSDLSANQNYPLLADRKNYLLMPPNTDHSIVSNTLSSSHLLGMNCDNFLPVDPNQSNIGNEDYLPLSSSQLNINGEAFLSVANQQGNQTNFNNQAFLSVANNRPSNRSFLSSTSSQNFLSVGSNPPNSIQNNLDSLLKSKTNVQIYQGDISSLSLMNQNQCDQSSLLSLDDNSLRPNGPYLSAIDKAPTRPSVREAAVQVIDSELRNFLCMSCSKVDSEADMEVVSCYKCKTCDFVSIHKCLVEKHMNIVHKATSIITESEIGCTKCEKTFSEAAEYRSHIESSHPIDHSAKADEIVKKLKKISPKEVAPVVQDKDPNVKKSEVSKPISNNKKGWKIKMRRELGSYICEFKGCNVGFRSLENLEFHKKCHVNGAKSFQCPECNENFEKWATIASHLWRSHANDMELHACDQCAFRTYSLSRLERIHKLIHKDEYLFPCDKCGKRFKNGTQMRKHRVRHFKTTPETRTFKCHMCSTEVSTRSLLRSHKEVVHNIKDKHFLCTYCDYRTNKKETLSLHMRKHTGEKPFVCDQCNYRTTDPNTLRAHKMRHSSTKKYKCPYCSYSAIQANGFKAHLDKQHSEALKNGLVFTCQLCNFKTLQKQKYEIHMMQHDNANSIQKRSGSAENFLIGGLYPVSHVLNISLFNGDSHLLLNKNLESFSNGFKVMSVCPQNGV